MESYPSILDPADPDVRVDFGMAEAEFARQVINRASAAQLVAIHSVLHEARQFPEIFVGHRALASSREDVEFAERAAIADLAMRLAVSENTIRMQEHQAATMIARTPIVWARFRDGEVSPRRTRESWPSWPRRCPTEVLVCGPRSMPRWPMTRSVWRRRGFGCAPG